MIPMSRYIGRGAVTKVVALVIQPLLVYRVKAEGITGLLLAGALGRSIVVWTGVASVEVLTTTNFLQLPFS